MRVEARVSNTRAPYTVTDLATVEVAETPGKPAVALKALPAIVPVGLPVGFQAFPSSGAGDTRYRFNFGDGSATTAWSAEPLRTHLYSSPGNYLAWVEMSIGSRDPASAVSDKKRVQVTSVISDSTTNQGNDNRGVNDSSNANGNRSANDNRASNESRNSNENQTPNNNRAYNANQSSNNNAGANDSGQSSNTRNANDARNSSNTGNTNTAGSVIGSESPASSPASEGETEPTDWWKYIIIAAIIAFAAYQLSSYLFSPRPSFVPHFDPGDSKVGGGRPLAIDLQTDVDPNLSGGEFRIDTFGGDLIKSKRNEI